MIFKPLLEHNMGMSHKSGDGLELPLFYVEGSIRLERDENLFKGEKITLFNQPYNIPNLYFYVI